MSSLKTQKPLIIEYVIGFVGSLIITIGAYWLVVSGVLDAGKLGPAVMGLAVLQFGLQMVCFLHIHHEKKPRWNLTLFAFTLMVLGIIVGGSMWIMYNLNYNMDHRNQAGQKEYMERQSGF